MAAVSREQLDGLYRRYNRREYVHPDPIEFLYHYDDPADREVAGLLASSLAYGRVAQILKSVAAVLEMTPRPARFVTASGPATIRRKFAGFRHRFTTGADMASLLIGARRVMKDHGSIGNCFASHVTGGDTTVVPALEGLVTEIVRAAGAPLGHLLPAPSRGSACKRLMLYLRWMIRSDDVDPGGWSGGHERLLVVPLDVHMHRISRALGITRRKSADLRTALEVTAAFGRLSPDDPVKYDFALTRLGIHPEADMAEFLKECGIKAAA